MLSIPDMMLLGGAALLFFGPEQLPKVMRKAGGLIRDVQNTSQSFIREMERAGDDTHYGPDISRAHLIEEAAGQTPLAPAYEPPVYEPASYADHPYAAADTFADHHEAIEYATAEHAEGAPEAAHAEPFEAAPESTPVLHDIVAPRAPSAPAGHDLPP
jgi:Sec-independent protein translocase protein TatA